MLSRYAQQYNQSFSHNEQGLTGLASQIAYLESTVPTINNMVCDGNGTVNECDALCGGAGCGKCGGISCGEGASTMAANALDLGQKSHQDLKVLQEKARNELNGILGAKVKADEALRQAMLAYERSLAAKNTSHDTTVALQQLLDDIDKFFEEDGAKPSEIRTIAEQVIKLQQRDCSNAGSIDSVSRWRCR